jgi:hypothetical protein
MANLEEYLDHEATEKAFRRRSRWPPLRVVNLPKELFSAFCITPNLRHVIMRSAGPDPYTYSRQSDEHLSHPFCTVDANQLESIFCAEQAATKL